MANHSSITRKDQVLRRLSEARGEWVDGPELANEKVGGSEGLRRVRELKAEGYPIHERKHPDPERDIYQYRLARQGGWICSRRCGNVSLVPLSPSLSPRVMFGECPVHGTAMFLANAA